MFKNHKLLILITLLLIIAAFFIYRNFYAAAPIASQDVKVVEVETASLGKIQKTIRLIGSIKAQQMSNLRAQDSGIFNIIIPSGKKVAKGELIASISNLEVQNRYSLNLAADKLAKKQLARALKLFKAGIYSKVEFENHKNIAISASKDLNEAKIALDKLKFYAPFDGIIGSYKIQSGSQLHSGDLVVSFYDPSKVIVEFDVPASSLPYVNEGQDVFIAGKNYKLTHIQKMLDEKTHMSPAYCEISCDNCIIGSNTDVDLIVEKKDKVIVIPFGAVFLRNGLMNIYVIKDNKTLVRSIAIGLREKNNIEILSGLEVGEEFVAVNPNRLYPDITVKTIATNHENN